MKALIFEDNKGVKNFCLVATSKKALRIFNKICHAEGRFICKSRERFNKIIEKNLATPDSFRQVFLGVGIYDYNGNFYNKLSQPEGNYFIEDYNERASISDIIKRAKIKFEFLFLS